MAKRDRVLTVEEVVAGHCSQEYLDLKERVAVLGRRIGTLCNRRFDLEDRIAVCGRSKETSAELEALTAKITEALNERGEVQELMRATK